jgi:hypothetical protein
MSISAVTSLASGAWSLASKYRMWLALGAGVLLLTVLLCGLAAWKGYRAGFDRADADRRAEVAEIHAHHAEALAGAERIARERLDAETIRAAVIEREYLAATQTIAAQRRAITRERIRHASLDVAAVGGACAFGPDWVRLYNEALGCDRGHALPAAASGAAGQAGAADAPDAGVLRGGAAVTDGVTPADILAHARDYGARCRALAAQLNALIDWAEGRR